MKRRGIRTMAVCLLLAALVCVCAPPYWPAAADGEIRALFVNVGKADAALFFLGEERYLVDAGTKGSFDALERALSLYGVTKLDGVIVTHLHKDHVGGLRKLLKSDISVERLYAGTMRSDEYEGDDAVATLAADYQIPLTRLAAGDSLPAGDSVFRVLGPLSRDAENENNNSLVMRLETPEGSMLLAGDMEREEEEELLDAGLIAPAAVLKTGHHGDDDATGKRLVLQVKPQWAIISTSTEEEPDTPDSKVMYRLWEVKAGVAVTQSATVGIMITLRGGAATAEESDLP